MMLCSNFGCMVASFIMMVMCIMCRCCSGAVPVKCMFSVFGVKGFDFLPCWICFVVGEVHGSWLLWKIQDSLGLAKSEENLDFPKFPAVFLVPPTIQRALGKSFCCPSSPSQAGRRRAHRDPLAGLVGQKRPNGWYLFGKL